ncbi:hypothetical protein FQR65_LT12962 [Abscondita terminalis]|nr:hypothetical protein FQR65_LT12962 [Abscondita terminalis]
MKLNVHHYAPEEIAVKVVDEKSIVVEAKHESKNENGSTFRQLTRQFVVPEGHDLKRVETKLSANGTLSIKAPKMTQISTNELVIPVTYIETKNYVNKKCDLNKLCNQEDCVTEDKENYLMKLNLHHYAPEEIAVKVVDEKSIVVEAKHESKNENGSTFRQLTRQFVVPEGHDLKRVETKLSANGTLSIKAPKMTQTSTNELVIPEDCVTEDKENYLMKLNLHHYAPEEIAVKVVDEKSIVVEAKHESKNENGSTFRQLTRQFVVPEGHDLKRVETKLSANGTLSIKAPKMTQTSTNELVIPEDCVTEDKENYLMKLNLHHYAPEEIAVKVVDEKSIVVEAKHESKNENGSTFRQLTRQFVVPEGHDLKRVETKLSANGTLSIKAPKMTQISTNELVIPEDCVTEDKENYLMKLNLHHYAPEEIAVKVVDEKSIVVEAKHESKNENGSTFRQLTRQFVVPEGHDLKRVETKLSANGTLSIKAPKMTQTSTNELVIPEDCVMEDKENYLMKLNLHHYAPEEIAVKVVNEKSIVVEAKHESKNENGSTFRQLTRQFVVPEGHDLKRVETKLSANGTLSIKAPKMTQTSTNELVIPVTYIETKK